MLNKDYTAENVLKSMGLTLPVNPTENKIIIVLRPSFHPEVCMIFDNQEKYLDIYSLMEHLWRRDHIARLPVLAERHPLSEELYAELMKYFTEALEAEVQGICIADGISLDVWGFEAGASRELRPGNECSDSYDSLAAYALKNCWECVNNPQLKNNLAEAAAYFDLNLPLEECDELPPVADKTLLVLGSQEAREGYFQQLDGYYKKRMKE